MVVQIPFLDLIPKEVNPYSFDRFRLISLCNASYKILAKLLANKIKLLLGKLISPLEGGFFKGRHLVDNVIQVQGPFIQALKGRRKVC